jgi:hypothetical protein
MGAIAPKCIAAMCHAESKPTFRVGADH